MDVVLRFDQEFSEESALGPATGAKGKILGKIFSSSRTGWPDESSSWRSSTTHIWTEPVRRSRYIQFDVIFDRTSLEIWAYPVGCESARSTSVARIDLSHDLTVSLDRHFQGLKHGRLIRRWLKKNLSAQTERKTCKRAPDFPATSLPGLVRPLPSTDVAIFLSIMTFS